MSRSKSWLVSKCIVVLVVSYFVAQRRMIRMSGVSTWGHIINGGKISMVAKDIERLCQHVYFVGSLYNVTLCLFVCLSYPTITLLLCLSVCLFVWHTYPHKVMKKYFISLFVGPNLQSLSPNLKLSGPKFYVCVCVNTTYT